MRNGALLVAAGLLAAPAALAAPASLPPAQIAVLDYQAVLRGSSAAQQARKQIDEYRQAYQEEMAREEDRLRDEEQELKRLQGTIPPEEFERRRRSFERRVQEAQRRAQEQARWLDSTFNKAMERLRREMAPIVANLTTELGFNLVVDKGQILFAARALDISDEVAAALNRKLPQLDIPQPER